jgi:hypothetical protein
MRRVALLPLIFLAVLAQGAPVKSRLSLGGTSIAENTFDLAADGGFTSTTVGKISGTDISSTVTGKLKDGKIVEATLGAKPNPTTTVEVRYKEGSSQIFVNGAAAGKPVKVESGLVFTNFHPQVTANLLSAKPGSYQILILDGGVLAPCELTAGKPVTAKGKTLQTVSGSLSGLSFKMVHDQGQLLLLEVPSQRFRQLVEGWDELGQDSMAKFPELSQTKFEVVTMSKVAIPMRDNVKLVAEIARPKAPVEAKFPVILSRTPYGRVPNMAEASFWASRGYIFISQDVRGRGDSDGDWDPFMNERKDGYDTIDWISKQPWCDGNVGMIGGSYLGFVQWCAAVEKHPALKAIIPQVSPPNPAFNIPWNKGLFLLAGNVWWSKIVTGKNADFSSMSQVPGAKNLDVLPLNKVDDAVFTKSVPFFDKWLGMSQPDQWTSFQMSEVAKVKIPVLAISGFWDGDGIGTRLNWEARQREGHANQWVIFGPWEHGFNAKTKFGDVDYGQDAVIDLDSVYLRFFDTYLKGKDVSWTKRPRVHLFVSGTNEWIDADDMPGKSWKPTTWYLSSNGPTNGRRSMGRLVEKPTASEPSQIFYNPADTLIRDQDTSMSEATTKLDFARNEQGNLIFRGPILAQPMTVSGSIEVKLQVSSTATEAQLSAIIAEENEKGEMRFVGLPDAMRIGWTAKGAPLLQPGKAYTVNLTPWWFAHTFAKGSRMVLLLSSDNFPSYNRSLGFGESPLTATKMRTAVNTVYHDLARPASIKFWVVPR